MGHRPTYYLETHSVDPYYNLAFEEYVLLNRKDADYLILWQNENTIVVGNNQITEAEINRSFVEANSVRVVRRATGGGAVYHDLGNLNYSFITDYHEEDQLSMERFTRPVVSALRTLGVEAEATGRNDILAGGRKVSGTAQKIIGGRILHHGTLLFDSDPAAIAGALKVDASKFTGKGAKSVQSRVGNIRPLLKQDMDINGFWGYLKKELSGAYFSPVELSEAELETVRRLKAQKYETWEWNYGRSPAAAFHVKRRFQGGVLEVFAELSGDRITNISFHGDFMARKPLSELCDGLKGAPFEEKTIQNVLRAYPLADYFGSISLGEILALLFYNGEH